MAKNPFSGTIDVTSLIKVLQETINENKSISFSEELIEEKDKMDLRNSIIKINDMLNNYNREEAIELIKRVRRDHPGKEQIAYVINDTPLEQGTDEMIRNTLIAEKSRLLLKLGDKNSKD